MTLNNPSSLNFIRFFPLRGKGKKRMKFGLQSKIPFKNIRYWMKRAARISDPTNFQHEIKHRREEAQYSLDNLVFKENTWKTTHKKISSPAFQTAYFLILQQISPPRKLKTLQET